MPRLATVARVLVAALLLCAQQAALEHAIWHAGGASDTVVDAKQSTSGHNPLCDQHAALGAVAGAIGCAAPSVLPVVHVFAALTAPAFPARDNAPPVSASRDPPVLL
ncbi:MAG: hypothetical protein ACREU5_00510 [Burkholderiales bacterium]